MVIQTDRPLLQQAIAAVERNDLPRANALFLEHLARARADPVALADYGNFCLRTGRHESASYLLHKAIQTGGADADLSTQLGFARLEVSDKDGARRNFEVALKQAPAHPLANYGLAQCHQYAGDLPMAIKGFQLAQAAQPMNLPFLLNLADAYHRAGDTQSAGNLLARAQQLFPNDSTMLLAYGMFLRDTGSYLQALTRLDRCAQLHPNEPTVLLEIARCHRVMGDYSGAIRQLDYLNRVSPDMAEYHEELGNCMQANGNHARRDLHWGFAVDRWLRVKEFSLAESLIERLLRANPHYVVAWMLKGNLLSTQQEYELAEAAYRQAIELDPAWLDGYANLAIMYEQINRISDAKAIADAGLAQAGVEGNQQLAPYIALLMVTCKILRRQKDYTHATEFLERIAALKQSEVERQHAAFERGRVLDWLGSEDDAITAFSDGNALGRLAWARDNPGDNTYIRGVEYMLGLVQNGWLKGWRKIDTSALGVDPVFLVGFPRSGTTLLTQILFCHEKIQIVEEKPLVQAMRDAVRSMPAGYPHGIPDFDDLDIAYLRDVYFRAAGQHGVIQSPKLLVDKLPLHVTTAGLIHRVFPNTRFVFAVRHPCDIVLSCFMQDFRSNEAMANFYTLADTVKLYVKTMDLWQAYYEQLGLTVHTIRYEDVVDDFDAQIHALCGYLKVPWQEGLRQFSIKAQSRGRINTPSYEQVSRPIYREARYRWERYREHLAPYLPELHPYIVRFGYSPTCSS